VAKQQQPERCEHIAEWLMIATKDLCEQAKTRIAFEIQTHYGEAVDAHLAKGESLEGAQVLALEELGDPKAAMKRFRRKHLTEKENKWVLGLTAEATGPYPKGNLVAETLLIVCSIGAIPFLRNFFPSTQHYCELAYCYAFIILASYPRTWILRFAAKKPPANLLTSQLVLIKIIGLLVSDCVGGVFLSLLLYQRISLAYALIIGVASLVLPLPATIIPWLRIWQKVRRENSGWDMAHSGSNPTSAA
jgi:hypothetical protein